MLAATGMPSVPTSIYTLDSARLSPLPAAAAVMAVVAVAAMVVSVAVSMVWVVTVMVVVVVLVVVVVVVRSLTPCLPSRVTFPPRSELQSTVVVETIKARAAEEGMIKRAGAEISLTAPGCSSVSSVEMTTVWVVAVAMISAVLVNILEASALPQLKGLREQLRMRRALEADAAR